MEFRSGSHEVAAAMHGIVTEHEDNCVRRIVLDRPEKLNAVDLATLPNPASPIEAVDEQVLVVEGRECAFSGGADVDTTVD